MIYKANTEAFEKKPKLWQKFYIHAATAALNTKLNPIRNIGIRGLAYVAPKSKVCSGVLFPLFQAAQNDENPLVSDISKKQVLRTGFSFPDIVEKETGVVYSVRDPEAAAEYDRIMHAPVSSV